MNVQDLFDEGAIDCVDTFAVIDDIFSGPLAWQAQALCTQTDPEVFFPEEGDSTQEAKAMCAQCEVCEQYLEYALANDKHFGTWGDLSERERRRFK